MEDLNNIIGLLFEQKGKLIWLLQQVPANEEQEKVIKEGEILLEKVNRLLTDFGYGLPG